MIAADSRIPKHRWRALAALLLVFAGSSHADTQPDPAAVLGGVLQTVLAETQHPYLPTLDVIRFRADLQHLYEKRAYAPLWSHNGVPTRQAINLIAELRAAENVGLRAANYEANALVYLLIDLTTSVSAGAEQWALFDIGLTTAVLAYAHDVHFGRIDPRDAGLDIVVEHARLDLPPLVEGLSHSEDIDSVLRDLEPQFTHYELLKHALRHYRELALEPALTQLPPLPSKSVKPGEAYEGAPRLRALLRAVGDLPQAALASEAANASLLDHDLVKALERFQARHGLDVDGALGKGTFAALTRPMRTRVSQIENTLERWRWLPPRLDSPPIIVNIPQFQLFAFNSVHDLEQQMLAMDVIVGKAFPSSRTPVFVSDMKYIVLRPYWDVPYSITTREMLPSIRNDPGYLASHRLEIVSGGGDAAQSVSPTPENLDALARGAFRLRQLPGSDNALGLAKFMMPNSYNVYLHSTPAQSLFGRSTRAFSHGCVRVADPVALAQYVLRDEPTWTREGIVAAMNGPRPLQINLRQPIRVFIVYGTAVATESGGVLFFEDIYGHDAQLTRLIEASRVARRPS